MNRVRVLIVDDSSAVRRLLAKILRSDSMIDVVGMAEDATTAMRMLEELKPDVVTLDVEMPEVSGLELLGRIRKLYATLPVIMFSSLTERAAITTLDALALGATDYVTKPAWTGSRERSESQVREQLIPKIKVLGTARTFSRGPQSTPRRPPARPMVAAPVELIVVGCSTGGPNALAALFAAIGADCPVPVLVTQHMPPVFTRYLADRLTAQGGIRFHEAQTGDVPVAGGAWIAPGDFHMRVRKTAGKLQITLDQGPPENSCRPAVDVMFCSAAEAFGARTLAVVLTGMGQDGLRGAQELRARGAQIIVQDEESSIVWGMPGCVANAGLADCVLPLSEIPSEMKRRLGSMAGPAQMLESASCK